MLDVGKTVKWNETRPGLLLYPLILPWTTFYNHPSYVTKIWRSVKKISCSLRTYQLCGYDVCFYPTGWNTRGSVTGLLCRSNCPDLCGVPRGSLRILAIR